MLTHNSNWGNRAIKKTRIRYSYFVYIPRTHTLIHTHNLPGEQYPPKRVPHRNKLKREGDQIPPREGKGHHPDVGVDVGLASVIQEERVDRRADERCTLLQQQDVLPHVPEVGWNTTSAAGVT